MVVLSPQIRSTPCIGRSLDIRRVNAVEYDRGYAIIAEVEPMDAVKRPNRKYTESVRRACEKDNLADIRSTAPTDLGA